MGARTTGFVVVVVVDDDGIPGALAAVVGIGGGAIVFAVVVCIVCWSRGVDGILKCRQGRQRSACSHLLAC